MRNINKNVVRSGISVARYKNMKVLQLDFFNLIVNSGATERGLEWIEVEMWQWSNVFLLESVKSPIFRLFP